MSQLERLLTLGTELELNVTPTKLRSNSLRTQKSKCQVAQVLRRHMKICAQLTVNAGCLVSVALPSGARPHSIISLRRPEVSWVNLHSMPLPWVSLLIITCHQQLPTLTPEEWDYG